MLAMLLDVLESLICIRLEFFECARCENYGRTRERRLNLDNDALAIDGSRNARRGWVDVGAFRGVCSHWSIVKRGQCMLLYTFALRVSSRLQMLK